MREDLYNEKEKEEFKKNQIKQLKLQRNMLREETTKIEKILKEEEEKNFDINKQYFKINTVFFISLSFISYESNFTIRNWRKKNRKPKK